MKSIQCKIRTEDAIQDLMTFASKIEHTATLSQLRVNGRQRNGVGFYSSFRCDVEENSLSDFVMECISLLEKIPTLSFELTVQDAAGKFRRRPHDSRGTVIGATGES